MPPPDGPVIFDFTRLAHATIAVDLVVNGEPVHIEQKLPLDYWDEMTPDDRAQLTLRTIHSGLWQLAEKLADCVTVTRYKNGARLGELPIGWL